MTHSAPITFVSHGASSTPVKVKVKNVLPKAVSTFVLVLPAMKVKSVPAVNVALQATVLSQVVLMASAVDQKGVRPILVLV
jgi:hypothetical protein